MVRVYVAGAWIHRSEIAKKIKEIEQHGHYITFNWTLPQYANRPSNRETLAASAKEDAMGVIDSQVVVAVMNDPKYEYRGTFHELGIARGCGIVALLYNPADTVDDCYCASVPFYWNDNHVHFKRWSDLIQYLDDLSVEGKPQPSC